MKKVPKLNYGDNYKATSFNNHKNELSNVIVNSGLTLNPNDNTQIAQVISNLSPAKLYDIYCTNSSNNENFVLTPKIKVGNYFPGMKLIFSTTMTKHEGAKFTIKLGDLPIKQGIGVSESYKIDDKSVKSFLIAAYFDAEKDIFIVRNSHIISYYDFNKPASFNITSNSLQLKLSSHLLSLTAPIWGYKVEGAGIALLNKPLTVINKVGDILYNNVIIKKASTLKVTEVSSSPGIQPWCGTFIKPDLFYLYSFIKAS